jgi:hypothetical protein
MSTKDKGTKDASGRKREKRAEGRGSTGIPVLAFVVERILIRLNGMNSVLLDGTE